MRLWNIIKRLFRKKKRSSSWKRIRRSSMPKLIRKDHWTYWRTEIREDPASLYGRTESIASDKGYDYKIVTRVSKGRKPSRTYYRRRNKSCDDYDYKYGLEHIRKRRRGTVVYESRKGILVVSGRGRTYMLPGGGANKGETRTKGAIRELREETGLIAHSPKFLFRYTGKVHRYGKYLSQDYHTVISVKARGKARPRHEVKHVRYYKKGSKIKLSHSTKEMIEKYMNIKNKSL